MRVDVNCICGIKTAFSLVCTNIEIALMFFRQIADPLPTWTAYSARIFETRNGLDTSRIEGPFCDNKITFVCIVCYVLKSDKKNWQHKSGFPYEAQMGPDHISLNHHSIMSQIISTKEGDGWSYSRPRSIPIRAQDRKFIGGRLKTLLSSLLNDFFDVLRAGKRVDEI